MLGCYPMLGATVHHLMIVNEEVHEKLNGMAYFKGLQPKHRQDVFVLTPQASDETVPHELVHTLGLGELAAYPLGKILVWKYRVFKNFPMLKSLRSSPMKYQKCSGCNEFALLHERYPGRAEHYVKA